MDEIIEPLSAVWTVYETVKIITVEFNSHEVNETNRNARGLASNFPTLIRS